MTITLIILGMIVLAFHIVEKVKKYTVKAVILKSIVSVLFVAVAVTAGPDAPLTKLVIVGLVCGLLGDIWLDLKHIFPEYDKTFLYAGFAAFGVGHILYVTGLFAQYGVGWFLVGSLVLACLAAGLVLALEKPMKLKYGRMKPVIALYGFLLFCTVFVSGGLLIRDGGAQLALFFAGSVLFAASDLVLSGTYFGTGKKLPIHIISNLILYYAGQFMIAASLGFLG